MIENRFNPIPASSTSGDRLDETVSSFLEQYKKYKSQNERVQKLLDLQDDNQQLDYLNSRLPSTTLSNRVSAPIGQVKSSLYHKVLRIFDTEASKPPKTKAVDTMGYTTELNLVDTLNKQIAQDSGWQEVWDLVKKRFKTEGTAVIQLGIDPKNNIINEDVCELAELYFDSTKEFLFSDSRQSGKVIKTIIREVEMDYLDFISQYPEMEGQVELGTPGENESRDVYSVDRYGQEVSKKITVHYGYSVATEQPVMCIYAGANAKIIKKYEGNDYPFFIKKSTGISEPFLPFIDFHFSSIKRGFYSVSIVGMIKDLAESYRRMINAAIPVFEKSVNPILLLLGNVDEREMEKMAIARDMQSLGLSPVIPIAGQAQIQTLKPDSIFNDFEAARRVVFRDASTRFGINLQDLEEAEQTATEFVGKMKTEAKAITGLYIINKPSFDKLPEYRIAIAVKFWQKNDKRLIKVVLSDEGDELKLRIDEVMIILKDWTGKFDTEVDLKIPMSTQDRANALTEIENAINQAVYGKMYTTMEEVELDIDSLYERASLRDLSHLYSKKRITQKFQSVLMARTQAQPQAQLPQTEQGLPDEIKRELAPQTMLAESKTKI